MPESAPTLAPAVAKGRVFWRKAQDQTYDTSGKPHHWVVLTDPVKVDHTEQVLWVPLSSVKPWLETTDTYVFNVGRSNKHIDATKDSCPFLEFAEVVPTTAIAEENPRGHGRLKSEHVVGICKALLRSGRTPPAAKEFYRSTVISVGERLSGSDRGAG